MSIIRKPLTVEAATVRLEELCARSEQCVSELRAKLARWMVPADEASRIIDSLVSRRFVDDNRYATAFVRDKYRFARWGRRKIAAGLYAKRIASDIISRALDEDIDCGEYDGILHDVLRAKARSIAEGNTYEGRTKLFRFGASRGFEPDLILRHIRSDNDLWPGSSEE